MILWLTEQQMKILSKMIILDEKGQMIYQMADENFANTVITPVPLDAPDFSSLVNEQIDQILLGNKNQQKD